MKNLLAFLLVVSFLFTGCEPKQETTPDPVQQNNLTFATLYSYYSQEYTALAYQAFNIAKFRLDERLKNSKNKKLAVVVDIDETVLDNSPYQAYTVVKNTGYPECWNEWCNLAEANAVPGAVEFLNYAVNSGVDVFYVSNRKEKYVAQATVKNLIDVGFPQAVPSHIMLRKDKSNENPNPSDKQSRRERILSQGYEIALLIGDNLGDFYTDEEKYTERSAQVDVYKQNFGDKFIVLPNAMYGNWVSALDAYESAKVDSLMKLASGNLPNLCSPKK